MEVLFFDYGNLFAWDTKINALSVNIVWQVLQTFSFISKPGFADWKWHQWEVDLSPLAQPSEDGY